MNKKCILILPYFGKFKNYFEMFLKSCSVNDKVNWLIISDQMCPKKYANIRWINMQFENFKNMIQDKFDFKIALNEPYKLCDYKPSYGYILEDYIKDYDYWGYCDCDLIFGNLNEMLLPLLENEYDKLFAAGHLTIYKNSIENNRRFMGKNIDGIYLYEIAFTNDKIFGFDEDCYKENVHVIFQNNNCKLYEEDLSFNISPTFYNLFREYYNSQTHRWQKEKLIPNMLIWDGKKIIAFRKNKKNVIRKEYLYAHLHMRKMANSILLENGNYIKICPEYFEKMKVLPEQLSRWRKEKRYLFRLKL